MKNQLATTHMSSKGQVVIPEVIRSRLGLESGTQFMVVADDDTVILKTITPPSKKDFAKLLKKVRQVAKASGLSQSDLMSAIESVRKKN